MTNYAVGVALILVGAYIEVRSNSGGRHSLLGSVLMTVGAVQLGTALFSDIGLG